MDNNFSSSELFCDLHNRKINSCGNSRHNRQVMPANTAINTFLFKEGDIDCSVQGDTSVVCWKGKAEVYIVTKIHKPLASGHFVKEAETASKALCIEGYYNKSMGFVVLSDRVIRSANGLKIST